MRFNHLKKIVMCIFCILFAAQLFAKDTLPVVKDSTITTLIKSKILLDKSISTFDINVATHHGVVSLAGKVDSDTQASSLVELAQATNGVKDVVTDNLHIKESKQPIADGMITAKIRGQFIKEKLLGDKDIAAIDIRVETNNGVVYLSGHTDNQVQKDNALKIAKLVNGVKRVESRIDVKNK